MFILETLKKTDKIIVAGHRGYSARFPENSLLAYKAAAEVGCDIIELDVTLSKDGTAMISHDDRLDRVTNGTGMIAEYTCEELKRLDLGCRHGAAFEGLKIPTFEEAMTLIKSYPGVLVDVDFKIGPQIWGTLREAENIITKLDMWDRCVFNSCDGDVIHYLHEKGVLTVGAPKSFRDKVNYTDRTYDELWAVCIPLDELTQKTAEQYLERDIIVAATSPDTPAQLRYALHCGATFMISDEPVPALKAASLLNM